MRVFETPRNDSMTGRNGACNGFPVDAVKGPNKRADLRDGRGIVFKRRARLSKERLDGRRVLLTSLLLASGLCLSFSLPERMKSLDDGLVLLGRLAQLTGLKTKRIRRLDK